MYVFERRRAGSPLVGSVAGGEEDIMSVAVMETMTEAEARIHIDAIKRSADGRRKHILALYEGRGWEALGHGSWRACVQKEFGKSYQHLYRELAVVPVEVEVSPDGEIGTIRESFLRPLLQLPEGQRKACWEAANDALGEREKLTAKHVQRAVNHALGRKAIGPQPEELRPSGFSPRAEKVEGEGPRWALRLFKGLAHDLQQLDWLRRNADKVWDGKSFQELCDHLEVDTTLVQILLETLGAEPSGGPEWRVEGTATS